MDTTTTTTTEPKKRGPKPGTIPRPYPLKSKLFRNNRRRPGWVTVNITIMQDDLRRINARSKALGLNRSAYFRAVANQDVLLDGPLAFHAVRFGLLQETEAALAALKKEQASAHAPAPGTV